MRGELLIAVGMLCSTVVGVCAQALVPVARALTDPVHPSRPPSEWTPASRSAMPPDVRAAGPALRVTPTADRTLIKAGWTLTGPFTVSAVFERTPASAADTAYGLVLGCTQDSASALAVVLRADGALSIRRPSDAAADWMADAGRATLGTATVDRLAVHVEGSTATVTVNGRRTATATIASGELDGPVGVHVGAGGDVLVSTFATESAASPEVLK